MPETVPTGIYFGFDLSELLVELGRYKEAVKNSGSDVSTEAVAGESFSYGPRRDMSLGRWQVEIQTALHMLDPETYPVMEKGRSQVCMTG